MDLVANDEFTKMFSDEDLLRARRIQASGTVDVQHGSRFSAVLVHRVGDKFYVPVFPADIVEGA